MSRIKKAFENGKAFIPFITAGYPDVETSEKNILSAIENGADLVEIGIPFSDPTAEGPVIQTANVEALKNGITTDKVFEMVKRLREKTEVPFVFMTYANVVFSYGMERFCSNAKEAGIDGIILPDVPFEEKDEFSEVMKKFDIDMISLIAPTSENRIAMIAAEAEGFIYIVSSLGVTGVRSKITTDIPTLVSQVKASAKVPCAIGFGISTPEQAKEMSRYADGVIVGSAIIKIISKYGVDSPKYVGEYVRSMKEAIR
ncbi:tryptophan synthase, alpha chain [Lachnospiraceae bacterium KH1T2]|nr:tryptophan synthase, alpha chain [Lachnospiraceae bacterium KH1T2]